MSTPEQIEAALHRVDHQGLDDDAEGQHAYDVIVEAARAHLAALRAPASADDGAWLLEWPQDDNLPARWWHPKDGWMLDPNKAIRFTRREDAEVYRDNGGRFVKGIIATEHHWVSLPAAPTDKATDGGAFQARVHD